MVDSFDSVVVDPLSAVESAIGLNFEPSTNDYVRFHDRIVQPVTSRGVAVLQVDNIGHATEARKAANCG